jgi:tetratricopeptide (TPR) repeat protein
MGRGRDTARAVAFGVVWFIITISPTSNTVVLSGILLAERTLYLPSVGLAAATGWLVLRLARERRRVAWAGLTVVVLAGGVRVWTRNPTWYDNATVLTVMIRDYPQSGRSQWVLGDALMGRGQTSQALLAYRAAIDLLGTHYKLVTEVARKLMAEGHYAAAEVLLGFAAEDIPRYPLAHALLALVRAEHADAEGAETYARRSLALEEEDVTRQHLLAWALAAQGRWEEAAATRARAEELGQAFFWQSYVYDAYMHQRAGDTVAVRAALDSAWERTFSEVGRAALDSVRMADFGLETRDPGGEGRQTEGRSP